MGLIPALESIGMSRYINYVLAILVAITVQTVLRRVVTLPRIGLVTFGPARQKKKNWLVKSAIMTTTILAILVALTFSGLFPGKIFPSLTGMWLMVSVSLFTVISIGLFAYFSDYPRLVAYAVVCCAGILASEALIDRLSSVARNILCFSVPGFVLMAGGFVMMFKFLKKYPLPTEANSVSL